MKKILFFTLIVLLSFDTYSQELEADDFVVITQENAAYPGFNARTYRGLFPVGHGQFKMFNYGGTPSNLSALGANETLGSFVFNGYDGNQNVISAVIQAKTITDSRDPRFNFLLSNGIGNQRPNRMTILGQSGNVGIGITEPTERLDIDGNIRMRAGATAGYIPVSDANGKMTWTAPSVVFPNPWELVDSVAYTEHPIGINTQETNSAQLYILSNELGVIRAENTYTGSNSHYAIYGKSVNDIGRGNGGYFEGGRHGIIAQGSGDSSIGTVYGIRASAEGIAGIRIGVYGSAETEGANTAYGLRGNATGATTNYGIYATAAGGTMNWAGYFDGNTYVDDTLSVGNELHINSDGSRTDRLVVMDESSGDAVYVKNLGVSSTNVSGYGIEVDAGFRGIDVDMNDTDLNGIHYGYYISNLTSTSTELTGSQYGMYAYVSGTRTTGEGNYSIYAHQAATPGSGDSWAGYFSGDVRITGTLDNTSDARLKKDVEDMEDALEIIQQLQPKTYQFKSDEYPHMALDERPQIGFIAQDVEKVLPQLVRTAIHPEFINDEGEESDIPNSPAVDVKSINYIGIIPVLTQGIKEMSTQITERDETIAELKEKNEDLQTQMDELKDMMLEMKSQFSKYENDLQNCCLNSSEDAKEAVTTIELEGNGEQPYLEQNAPNPFNSQTQIRYYIPSSAAKAQMVITDNRGAILKMVSLTETGFGTVFIKAGELLPGTYAYTLFVDGNKVATKQMILIK